MITISFGDVLTVLKFVTAFGGVLIVLFRLFKKFRALEVSRAHRQEDADMTFRCLRVLLETQLGRHDDAKEPIGVTLDELNAHMAKRTAGLGGATTSSKERGD